MTKIFLRVWLLFCPILSFYAQDVVPPAVTPQEQPLAEPQAGPMSSSVFGYFRISPKLSEAIDQKILIKSPSLSSTLEVLKLAGKPDAEAEFFWSCSGNKLEVLCVVPMMDGGWEKVVTNPILKTVFPLDDTGKFATLKVFKPFGVFKAIPVGNQLVVGTEGFVNEVVATGVFPKSVTVSSQVAIPEAGGAMVGGVVFNRDFLDNAKHTALVLHSLLNELRENEKFPKEAFGSVAFLEELKNYRGFNFSMNADSSQLGLVFTLFSPGKNNSVKLAEQFNSSGTDSWKLNSPSLLWESFSILRSAGVPVNLSANAQTLTATISGKLGTVFSAKALREFLEFSNRCEAPLTATTTYDSAYCDPFVIDPNLLGNDLAKYLIGRLDHFRLLNGFTVSTWKESKEGIPNRDLCDIDFLYATMGDDTNKVSSSFFFNYWIGKNKTSYVVMHSYDDQVQKTSLQMKFNLKVSAPDSLTEVLLNAQKNNQIVEVAGGHVSLLKIKGGHVTLAMHGVTQDSLVVALDKEGRRLAEVSVSKWGHKQTYLFSGLVDKVRVIFFTKKEFVFENQLVKLNKKDVSFDSFFNQKIVEPIFYKEPSALPDKLKLAVVRRQSLLAKKGSVVGLLTNIKADGSCIALDYLFTVVGGDFDGRYFYSAMHSNYINKGLKPEALNGYWFIPLGESSLHDGGIEAVYGNCSAEIATKVQAVRLKFGTTFKGMLGGNKVVIPQDKKMTRFTMLNIFSDLEKNGNHVLNVRTLKNGKVFPDYESWSNYIYSTRSHNARVELYGDDVEERVIQMATSMKNKKWVLEYYQQPTMKKTLEAKLKREIDQLHACIGAVAKCRYAMLKSSSETVPALAGLFFEKNGGDTFQALIPREVAMANAQGVKNYRYKMKPYYGCTFSIPNKILGSDRGVEEEELFTAGSFLVRCKQAGLPPKTAPVIVSPVKAKDAGFAYLVINCFGGIVVSKDREANVELASNFTTVKPDKWSYLGLASNYVWLSGVREQDFIDLEQKRLDEKQWAGARVFIWGGFVENIY